MAIKDPTVTYYVHSGPWDPESLKSNKLLSFVQDYIRTVDSFEWEKVPHYQASDYTFIDAKGHRCTPGPESRKAMLTRFGAFVKMRHVTDTARYRPTGDNEWEVVATGHGYFNFTNSDPGTKKGEWDVTAPAAYTWTVRQDPETGEFKIKSTDLATDTPSIKLESLAQGAALPQPV